MTVKQRIEAFVQVGNFIERHYQNTPREDEKQLHEGLNKVIELAHAYNNWFIPQFIDSSLRNISTILDQNSVSGFAQSLQITQPKTVAVICAGNIPMVCFHDILCVLLSGHNLLIKLSDDDKILPPFFLKLLVHYAPEFESSILFSPAKLANFDAVIATGSNNTASHFQYYFSKYPNIIRKNRTSVAILTGKETNDDLKNLGMDVFQYFGLGCRSVNKLLVPANYSFNQFFESIVDFGYVVNNKKYGNNYDYHRAIYLLESLPFLDNNFVMLRESSDLHSPVGVIYYQYYSHPSEIEKYLKENENQLQCIVGQGYVPFGYSQQPVITEFADKINTLDFLVNL